MSLFDSRELDGGLYTPEFYPTLWDDDFYGEQPYDDDYGYTCLDPEEEVESYYQQDRAERKMDVYAQMELAWEDREVDPWTLPPERPAVPSALEVLNLRLELRPWLRPQRSNRRPNPKRTTRRGGRYRLVQDHGTAARRKGVEDYRDYEAKARTALRDRRARQAWRDYEGSEPLEMWEIFNDLTSYDEDEDNYRTDYYEDYEDDNYKWFDEDHDRFFGTHLLGPDECPW